MDRKHISNSDLNLIKTDYGYMGCMSDLGWTKMPEEVTVDNMLFYASVYDGVVTFVQDDGPLVLKITRD